MNTFGKRQLKFERNEKLRLIRAVRARRLLWDNSNITEYHDQHDIRNAWQLVGAELNRNSNECKVAWRSLRQSFRYHCKVAYTKISTEGHQGGYLEIDPLESYNIPWEYANQMAFLLEPGIQRSNFVPSSTPESPSDYCIDQEFLDDYKIEDANNHYTIEAGKVNDDDKVSTYYQESTHKITPLNTTLIDVLCRTCTQPTDPDTSKNLFEPHNNRLLQHIKDLTELHLTQDEDLSDFMCKNCHKILEAAIEFREVCIESQAQVLRKEHKSEPEEIYNIDTALQQDFDCIDLNMVEERLETIADSSDDNYLDVDLELLQSSTQSSDPKNYKCGSISTKYQCHNCGLMFKSQDLLKMHMHEVHNTQLQTRFVCKHCGHDFKYSAPLIEHLKIIGVHFSYQCEDCDQKFHSRHFLKKHKRRVHGQTVENICHICGQNFTTGFNLRNHIIRHSGSRPHKCKLCSSAFSTAAELNNHKRTHENVRPYPCRYGCGKSFRHCSNRSTHERVHMHGNLRPFQCEYCDKSFVTKGDCRAHQMVHTMSRKFSCATCQQSFKLLKHYQQHLTTKSHKKLESEDITNRGHDSTS